MFIFNITKVIDLIIIVFILLVLAIVRSTITLRKQKKLDIINKEIAIQIIEQFEELLLKKNIKILSDDKEGNENEACIYGTEYYQLEDSIVEILNNIKTKK